MSEADEFAPGGAYDTSSNPLHEDAYPADEEDVRAANVFPDGAEGEAEQVGEPIAGWGDGSRHIIMRGGEGDGWEMVVPKRFAITYAQDEEGTLLYVNSGNIDEQGREIWVPVESNKEEQNA